MAVLGRDDVTSHQGRDQRKHPNRTEEQEHQGDGKAGVVHIAAEGHVVGPAALGDQGDHEDDRHGQGGAQTEVGALLGTELAELPSVDGQDAGIHTGSPI